MWQGKTWNPFERRVTIYRDTIERKEYVGFHDGSRSRPLGPSRPRTRTRTMDVQDGPGWPAPSPRRRARSHPRPARRAVDARLREDPGARGAQRGEVAAQRRLDLPDAPAAR